MRKPIAVPLAAPDLALDFVNTLNWRGAAAPTETLNGVDDLLRWCADAAGVTSARAWPEAALPEAIALRETLARIFAAAAEGETAQAADLDRLAAALAATPARTRLQPLDGGYAWRIPAPASVPALLAPVLWSAGDLLAGPSLAKVRRCRNDRCRYLFLDTSRAGNRRWCDMAVCGNRAKARRHYHRRGTKEQT